MKYCVTEAKRELEGRRHRAQVTALAWTGSTPQGQGQGSPGLRQHTEEFSAPQAEPLVLGDARHVSADTKPLGLPHLTELGHFSGFTSACSLPTTG
jgi:hypothetical protein